MTRLVLKIAALSLAACGNGVSLSDLPEEFESRVCKKQVECGTYPDVETCRAASGFDVNSEIPQLEQSVADGRATYDEGQAGDCLDAIENALTCESFVSDPAAEAELDACDTIVAGNVETGGECYAEGECADNGTCMRQCNDNECCAGTCVAGEPESDPVEIGGDCSEADCVANAWCKNDSSTGAQTCTALGGEGDVCQGFSGCGAGLACDGFFGEGACVRPAAEGETCDPDQGFGLLSCARDDNWCDPADTTCKKLHEVGDSCDVELRNCVNYAYCDAGTCAMRAAEGQSCDEEIGPTCLGDLECSNGTCQFEQAPPVCGPDA